MTTGPYGLARLGSDTISARAKEVIRMNHSIATIDPEIDTEPDPGKDKTSNDEND